MSKAVELPINVMVIIVICVIILLALVAMYFTGFGPFSQTVGIEGIRGEACRQLAQGNRCGAETSDIEITKFDADKDGGIDSGTAFDTTGCGNPAALASDNLRMLCACYYSMPNESSCKNLCGCGGGSGGGGGVPPPGCDGDGVCDPGEDFIGCPSDCYCNNDGNCDIAQGETAANCPLDCIPACDNDGQCDIGEDFVSCPADCFCDNDGVCDILQGESPANCAGDCICDNDLVCEPLFGENSVNCPGDCPPCGCSWVLDAPLTACSLFIFIPPPPHWVNGFMKQCICAPAPPGCCYDSTGTLQASDTGFPFCIV